VQLAHRCEARFVSPRSTPERSIKMAPPTKNPEGDTGGSGAGERHPIDYPSEEEILAYAPEGWTNYIRQLGTEFIAQVSVYNEVLAYLNALTLEGATFDLASNTIGPNRIDWLAGPRVLLLENSGLGVCWMYWIASDWEPLDVSAPQLARHRALQLEDVRACVKIMSPRAYAEHVAWEMARAKH